MTKVERNQIRKEINRIRKEAEEEREKIHQETAKEAERIWNCADLAGSEHPYLIRKGVKVHGLKQNNRDGPGHPVGSNEGRERQNMVSAAHLSG